MTNRLYPVGTVAVRHDPEIGTVVYTVAANGETVVVWGTDLVHPPGGSPRPLPLPIEKYVTHPQFIPSGGIIDIEVS